MTLRSKAEQDVKSGDLKAMLEEEDLEAERQAVEDIKPLYEWKQTEAAVKAELARLDPSASEYERFGRLRRFLHDHLLEEPRLGVMAELHDTEAGLVALLQSGGFTDGYDTPLAIRERSPALYQRLLELDCLRVDEARVKQVVNEHLLETADVTPFRHQIARTPSLRVKKVGE